MWLSNIFLIVILYSDHQHLATVMQSLSCQGMHIVYMAAFKVNRPFMLINVCFWPRWLACAMRVCVPLLLLFFLGKFYSFKEKKVIFRTFFSAFYGQHSVTAAWATRSPWSIFNISILFAMNLGAWDNKTGQTDFIRLK